MSNFSQPLCGFRLHTRAVICLLAFISSSADASFGTQSLEVQNRTPYVHLFHPARADVTDPLEDGEYEYAAQAEVASYISLHRDQDETFFIDGETLILTQSIALKIQDTDVRVSLPWLRHGRGKLDRLIYDFHDILKMPQNGRSDERHDELLWHLSKNGETIHRLEQVESGLGDIHLRFSNYLENKLQIHTSVKLPTGSFGSQTGSRNLDVGIALSQANPDWLTSRAWLNAYHFSFWWGGSFNYLGKSAPLDKLEQNNWMLTSRQGFAWHINPKWEFIAQADENTAAFDSDIRELGWIAIQATLAMRFRPSPKQFVTFSLSEDLRPRVTPDAVFSLDYRIRF